MNYFPFICSSKDMSCVWGWVYSSWRCLKSTFGPWATCWAALLSSASQVTRHTPAFCWETILHGSFMFPNALWADALTDLYCKNALSSQGYLNREYTCKFQSVNEIRNSGSQPGMILAMSGDIFACHKWVEMLIAFDSRGLRCCQITYNAQKHPQQWIIIHPKMFLVLRLRNPLWKIVSPSKAKGRLAPCPLWKDWGPLSSSYLR